MELLQEIGTFIISTSGNHYHGFFFKGDDSFGRRMTNFCYNYGVTTGKVRRFEDGSYYVLTKIEKLKEALLNLFRGEIILAHKDIDYTAKIDENEEAVVDWDQNKVDMLALDRLNQFWEKITFRNLLMTEDSGAYTFEHNIGCYQDAEPEMITE